jgi:hypothetical protein
MRAARRRACEAAAELGQHHHVIRARAATTWWPDRDQRSRELLDCAPERVFSVAWRTSTAIIATTSVTIAGASCAAWALTRAPHPVRGDPLAELYPTPTVEALAQACRDGRLNAQVVVRIHPLHTAHGGRTHSKPGRL